MKYISVFFNITFLIISQHAFGQNGQGSIEGYVVNQENQPAAYSTVVLMNKDSVFMNGTLIGENGAFLFDKLAQGEYHFMVRNVEFSTYVSGLISVRNSAIKVDTVRLKASVNDLDEVVIKGEKALVEIRPDKMVYNVSASVNATGNNALELVGKSPGVRVDMDNNIILQGKTGVQIYINGRPSRISGSDLANMLEGMQSENIESIEIITNPSAKYDAEGTGGIINIVLKKELATGFNGNINGGYSKGIEPRTSVGTSLNYSGQKLNLFSSLNYADNNYTFNRNEIMLREDFLLDMLSLRPTHRQGVNIAGGMDYKINREHTISIDAKAIVNQGESPQSSNTLVENLSNTLLSERLIAKTLDEGGSVNYNANIHYSFVPNRSSEFTTDVSYGYYANDKDTDQPNAYYSLNDSLIRSTAIQYSATTSIDLFSAQMDYTKSLGKTNFSTGVKYSLINTNNKLQYSDVIDSIPVLNINRSNDFTYLEEVAAAYVIVSWQPTDEISVNAGMRVENTSSLGELVSVIPGPDDIVPRDYLSFFPNVSIAYDDKENQAISLGFSRRITRPNYQNLNPFESRLSELSAWKGNPFLKPNYISNYQLSYSYKRKLVISNTYSVTNNFFANIFQTEGEKGNVITPRNMDKAIVNGLSISYPLKVTPWWEFSGFFLYNYEAYSGNIEGTIIDMEQHVVDFRIQNNLKLLWDMRMELSGYITGPSVWRGTTDIDGYYSIDIGLKKEFMNEKLLLQASVSDLFNTGSLYHYSSNYGGMVIDGDAFFDGRRVSVNASYKFGNQKVKARKSKSSLDKELERISD